MKKTLKGYTLKYLVVALLAIIAIWAALFYAFILEEVYDNIDDGLKNRKIQIIRETYKNPDLLNISKFGIEEFKITPSTKKQFTNNENEFKNEFIFMEYDDDLEPYRELKTFFTHSNGKSYALEIRTSTVEEDELLEDLLYALVFLYIGLILSIFLLYNTLLSKLWNPFFDVINKLETYKIGKSKKFNINPNDVEEFNILKRELNLMISSNETNFLNQKQFTENASHELQTPIAITIHKLDVLLEDNLLTENQLHQISDIKQILERMANLNKTLLLLSKIDNKQYLEKEKINFNHLITSTYQNYLDLVEYKDLNFRITEKDEFITFINSDLARILLSNLLRNAIRYTKEKGEIIIEITENKIIFKNTAYSGSLDSTKIFNRFYKENTHANSNGLGLAIINAIIDQSPKMSINYFFKDNFHQFEILKMN